MAKASRLTRPLFPSVMLDYSIINLYYDNLYIALIFPENLDINGQLM